MPDWAVSLLTALVGGLFGAGGLVAFQRARSDARLSAEAQQDEHTLKLINALGASETEFRNAVLLAYQSEVSARRDLDSRLTTTQNQLAVVTLERDDLKRKLEHAQSDLDKAHQKIRRMENEIATLKQQQNIANTE